MNPSDGPVGSDDTIFFIVAAAHLFGQRGVQHAGAVIGMDRIKP